MLAAPVQPAHEGWQFVHVPELSNWVDGHTQVPNETVAPTVTQVTHSELDGPLHVAQLAWQVKHVLVGLSGYLLDAQAQVPDVRTIFRAPPPVVQEHEAQLVESVHVAHKGPHLSQRFRVVFA